MESNNEIGFNTRCEHFKNDVLSVVNNSGLPIGVMYFVIRNIMVEIENTYYGALNSEAQEKKIEVEE